MAELPNAPVKRILTKSGVERISGSAIGKAAEAAEAYLADLAKAAVESAANDRPPRKTVMDKDVDSAREALKSGGMGAEPEVVAEVVTEEIVVEEPTEEPIEEPAEAPAEVPPESPTIEAPTEEPAEESTEEQV